MDLRDYVGEQMELNNRVEKDSKLRFFAPKVADDIVKLYQTYHGSTSKMHPLDQKRVNEYLDKGFAFAGAYYDNELVAIAVSKQFPENYPYFAVPNDEQDGKIYTLGGLYVRPDHQGQGYATKLSRIIIRGTENYGQQTKAAAGIGYEVSYDNEKSLKALRRQGNYIGYYQDQKGQEGLSVLLYRPFCHQGIKIDAPEIKLTSDETVSRQNLADGLQAIAQQNGINGTTKIMRTLNDGNLVTLEVLNNTPLTMNDPLFTFEQ